MQEAAMPEIGVGKFGKKLTLRGRWNSTIANKLKGQEIHELELNYAKGWSDTSVEFLSLFTDLAALTIINWNLDDLSPVRGLLCLKCLKLFTYSKTKIDFSQLDELEELSIEWSSGFSNFEKSSKLTTLFINRLPRSKISSVGDLGSLEDLALLNCRALDLDSIRHLRRLRNLRIGVFGKLVNNQFLRDLHNLETLIVERCSGFESLESLRGLTNLRELTLIDVGTVRSLSPLLDLSGLRKLVVAGRSVIADQSAVEVSERLNLVKLSLPDGS